MNFLSSCWAEDERTDQFATSTLGLIGDFGDTYKRAVREAIMQDWVMSAILYGRQRGASKQARTNAAYAQQVRVRRFCYLLTTTRLSKICRNNPPLPPRFSFSLLVLLPHVFRNHQHHQAALCRPRTFDVAVTLHGFGYSFASHRSPRHLFPALLASVERVRRLHPLSVMRRVESRDAIDAKPIPSRSARPAEINEQLRIPLLGLAASTSLREAAYQASYAIEG